MKINHIFPERYLKAYTVNGCTINNDVKCLKCNKNIRDIRSEMYGRPFMENDVRYITKKVHTIWSHGGDLKEVKDILLRITKVHRCTVTDSEFELQQLLK